MSQKRRILDQISSMIPRNVPGSAEERQLIHLIDANAYMDQHKCSFTDALRATAKRRPGDVTGAESQLDHIERARQYQVKHYCSMTEALQKTAKPKETEDNSRLIAEQLAHVERAKKYQQENKCTFEEALSITAPTQHKRKE